MLGASIQTPPRELLLTVAVACTWVTGTANAGRPYTTACSPNRMILPGARVGGHIVGQIGKLSYER